jgi:autotransporter-associated beta strand protein
MHRLAAQGAPLFFVVQLCVCIGSPVLGGIKEDVGLVTLQTFFGYAPTGEGVAVSMTEASVNGGYTPMTELPDFAGKHFEFRNGITGNSQHATMVAQNFFGLSTSIAPGISEIELYEADNYMSGFLRAGMARDPSLSPQNSRVGNHSWISNGGSMTALLDVLTREDWVIEQDEFIQVVGVNNGDINTNPIVSNAFNVIAVGRTDGLHAIDTLQLGGAYTSGRTRPDIVAPTWATSFSTPIVAAASAMLVDLGRTNSYLSDGSITPSRFPDSTIYHAETSEVVKAALMAGASRLAFNSSDPSMLVDYRADPARQATNGLDKRFGAGQLNVYNSFSIVVEGEQNSTADGRAADVSAAGFDYDPHFGGAEGANADGTYEFTAGWTGQPFTASLVWNAQIDIGLVKQGQPRSAATLYNLDLSLFDVTDGGAQVVASSKSADQNTENIWTSLVAGHRYRLEVSPGAGQAPFDWDYALAWSGIGTLGWLGTGPWDASSLDFMRGDFATTFNPGEHVAFTDGAASGDVFIHGAVAPASVLVDNQAIAYTFSGGSIDGATGLIKRGLGQLTLASANGYAGPTIIQSGKVMIAADGALGQTTGPTSVSQGGALVIQGSLNYSQPEPVTIVSNGPLGQGAIESIGGDNRFAGPVTATGNSAIGVANGSLSLSGNVNLPANAMLNKIGMGSLSLAGGIQWGPSAAIFAAQGQTRLEPAAGSIVNVSSESPSLQIAGGVVRVDATNADPFTDTIDQSLHINVYNHSINGFIVESGAVTLDQLSGLGSTYVDDGAHLTVDQIEQDNLYIGADAVVTLAPGGGTSVLHGLSFALTPTLSAAGEPALGSGQSQAGQPASVPEPSSLALIATALGCLAPVVRRRRHRSSDVQRRR